MPTPIGPETSWLCPSLNPTQSGSPDELISGVSIGTASTTTAVWTSDTDNGGTYSVTGDNAKRQFNTMLGVTSTDTVTKVGTSMWVKFDSSSVSNGTSGLDFDVFRFGYGTTNTYLEARISAGVTIMPGLTVGAKIDFLFVGTGENPGTLVYTPLEIKQTGSHTDWVNYWTSWHHIYVELDYSAGGTDYSYFATTPYFKLYIDGAYVDQNNGPVWVTPISNNSTGFGTGPSMTIPDTSEGGTGNTNFAWDDMRMFCNTFPTASELTTIASVRGVEGSSGGGGSPSGLGTEKFWVLPSEDTSNVNTAVLTDFSSSALSITTADSDGSATWTADTDEGGAYKVSGFDGQFSGLTDTGTTMSMSIWAYLDPSWLTTSGGLRRYLCGYSNGNINEFSLYVDFSNNDFFGGHYQRAFFGMWITGLTGISNRAFVVTAVDPIDLTFHGWKHITVTADYTKPSNVVTDGDDCIVQFYLDGVLTMNGGSAGSSAGDLSGGYDLSGLSLRAGTASFFGGLQPALVEWDDCRIFPNTTLSQSEITNLASTRGYSAGGGSSPPSSAFHNPFKSKAFHTLIGQIIR